MRNIEFESEAPSHEKFMDALGNLSDLVFKNYADDETEPFRTPINATPHLQIARSEEGGSRDYDIENYENSRRRRPKIKGSHVALRDLVIEAAQEPGHAPRVYGVVFGGSFTAGQTRYEGVLLGRDTVVKIAKKYDQPNPYDTLSSE